MAAEQQLSTATDDLKNVRREAYELLRSSMHAIYDTDFVHEGSKSLTIVFSPNAKFMLRKYGFANDVLYVADRKLHYYTHNPGRQCKFLWSFIQQSGYAEVVFVGSSKGGTGALLWASLTSRLNPTSKIVAIAFSPQVQLYPFNENLTPLPSYVNNMKLVDRNEAHRVNFQTYGDLVGMIGASPCQAIVVFGSRSTMDAMEARRLYSLPNVLLRPIDVSFHGSVIPFVTDLMSHDKIVALADKLTKDAAADNDLSATITQTRDEFVAELKSVRCPDLNTLIEQSILRLRDARFV
ncbi:hypothetical protein [Rhizobium sp. NFR12]|uniref:hypothetical protein n=1 Tax=Rhizobium sp. NFR12 TaxID=1566261 RepID=UPI0008A79A9C|nr:hypothetical protein [Rhizobium sp. NFR12]SEH27933.1 hypothetical protein SAMN03159407_3388 [Rhizobium sp. NFR12]